MGAGQHPPLPLGVAVQQWVGDQNGPDKQQGVLGEDGRYIIIYEWVCMCVRVVESNKYVHLETIPKYLSSL